MNMNQPDAQMMEITGIKTEIEGPLSSTSPLLVLANQNEQEAPVEEVVRTSLTHDLDVTLGSISIQVAKGEGKTRETPIAPPVAPLSADKPTTSQAIRIAQMKDAAAKQKRDMEEEEREKMQVLVSNFTEDQLDRYEMFRRAAFPKASIKRLMQTITGNSVSQNAVIAMAGIAKVFIGEIVEEGLDVMERISETGPIQPKHIREAVRKIRMRGGIPNSKTKRYSPYPL